MIRSIGPERYAFTVAISFAASFGVLLFDSHTTKPQTPKVHGLFP